MHTNDMPRKRVAYIVDDDGSVRDALSVLLSTADIESKTFASAELFLETADLHRGACVLLDIRLPGLSGLELLKRLAERHSNVAVIMITGHGDVPMAVDAMKAGAFHFVEKPFDPEVLLQYVEEAQRQVSELNEMQARSEEIAERYASLTPREQEVMELLIEGLPNKLIATRLGISTRTAEHHRAAVMKKMKAWTLSHLVRISVGMRPGARYSSP
jgi:two-component system response regulator FixJ